MSALTDLQAQLAALKTARNSGVLIVRHGDEQVTYRSLNEIQKTIDSIQKEIDSLSGAKPSGPKYVTQHCKGY